MEILHLRDNKLEALGGFSGSMKCLQYINLRWVLPPLCWDQRSLHQTLSIQVFRILWGVLWKLKTW